MAPDAKVSYRIVRADSVGSAGSVFISQNKGIAALHEAIASKEKVPREFIRVWKPAEPCPRKRNAFVELFEEYNKSVCEFCDEITDQSDTAVSELLSASSASTTTALVVTIEPLQLSYFLILEGQPQPYCRTVTVSPNDDVRDLRRHIATKEGLDEEIVSIYKPSTTLDVDPRTFLERCSDNDNDPRNFCNNLMGTPKTTCAELMEPGPPADPRTLIVTTWTSSGPVSRSKVEDVLGELTQHFIRGSTAPRDTPSSAAELSNYISHQNSDLAILDGRYVDGPADYAPPITLYHPVFARFVARTRGGTLPPLVVAPDSATSKDDPSSADADSELPSRELGDFLLATFKFMISASGLVRYESDREGIKPNLTDLLNRPIIKTVNQNQTSADYTMIHSVGRSTAALAIVEVKADLGIGDSDPSVQGSFSYIHHWTDQKGLLNKCFCPSFIIASAGPYIAICGAIWTADVVYHRLTDWYWVGHARAIDTVKNVPRIARMFYALRLGLDELQESYTTMAAAATPDPDAIDVTRIFPLATCCVLRDGTKVKFRYLRPFKRAAKPDPACVTFLVGREDNNEQVVVKFVERYSTEAHELLAEHGYAPKLLSIGPVWDDELAQRGCDSRQMVMMEYVDGEPCIEKYGGGRVPQDVVDQVRKALALLHEKNMVHGDIRERNILVDKNKQVKIVDFDWAGTIGEVEYPLDLNVAFPWAKGVRPGGAIEVAHDNEMCEKLGC